MNYKSHDAKRPISDIADYSCLDEDVCNALRGDEEISFNEDAFQIQIQCLNHGVLKVKLPVRPELFLMKRKQKKYLSILSQNPMRSGNTLMKPNGFNLIVKSRKNPKKNKILKNSL